MKKIFSGTPCENICLFFQPTTSSIDSGWNFSWDSNPPSFIFYYYETYKNSIIFCLIKRKFFVKLILLMVKRTFYGLFHPVILLRFWFLIK